MARKKNELVDEDNFAEWATQLRALFTGDEEAAMLKRIRGMATLLGMKVVENSRGWAIYTTICDPTERDYPIVVWSAGLSEMWTCDEEEEGHVPGDGREFGEVYDLVFLERT